MVQHYECFVMQDDKCENKTISELLLEIHNVIDDNDTIGTIESMDIINMDCDRKENDFDIFANNSLNRVLSLKNKWEIQNETLITLNSELYEIVNVLFYQSLLKEEFIELCYKITKLRKQIKNNKNDIFHTIYQISKFASFDLQ